MRRALFTCVLALTVAGCGGGAEEEAAAPASGGDQPVSSSADPSPPPPPSGTPASTKACRRLGRRIVGDPLEDAAERARRRGCTVRVAVLDGEGQVLTEDFQPARIDVRVDGGVVTGVEFMG